MFYLTPPASVCLLRKRYFLMRITRETFDARFLSYEGAQDYPFPAELHDPERKQRYHYEPLAYTEANEALFLKILDEEDIAYFPFPEFFIQGVALRLVRALSY